MTGDYMKNQTGGQKGTPLLPSLSENEEKLRGLFADNDDLRTRYTELFGHRMLLLFLDSMTDKAMLTRGILRPVMTAPTLPEEDGDCLDYLQKSVLVAPEVKECEEFEPLCRDLMKGAAILLLDGVGRALVIDAKGFDYRAVAESSKEVTELGSQEGFIEVTTQNIALLTRRMTTPRLKFLDLAVGRAKTRVTLTYLEGCADPALVAGVRASLENAELPAVLDSAYLQDFLTPRRRSFFTRVGSTTRPDTLCAKLEEGRVGIFTDGSPEVLTLPYVFWEGLQSPDDYSKRAFFATFVRVIKFLSILISVLLPASYVALAMFNPEAFPSRMLYNLMDADLTTPFTVATEVILMQFLYEVMHEAGLRLPKPVGQSVSIVGSLVIGDAAVTSGIIGAPTVIVSAISVICAFVVPTLYSQISLLRFVLLLMGAFTGIYGVMLLFVTVFVTACAEQSWGVPYLAPLLPADRRYREDALRRARWRTLGRGRVNIRRSRGSRRV